MRTLEARGQTGRSYTVFSDSQAAIRRAMHDGQGPGQQWEGAIIEFATRAMARNNHIWICWAPAHRGIPGNEVADSAAKEAAGGQSEEVLDEVRRQTSLPHPARKSTERRSATAA